MKIRDAIRGATETAVTCLCDAQDASGAWNDFWLAIGTSDEWVTAYTGLALAEASRAADLSEAIRLRAAYAVRAAAGWLTARARADGGWGYNATALADADSTAHGISFLAAAGLTVPPAAVACLLRHDTGADGFRTYAFSDADHQWTRPVADVTAAALRALFDAGEISRAELRRRWARSLAAVEERDGTWRGYWWRTAAYPTAVAIEAWELAGKPPLPYPVGRPGAESAFDAACSVATLCRTASSAEASARVLDLMGRQHPDGGWPSAFSLRVAPSHPERAWSRRALISADGRRNFTTSTAVRALLLAHARFAETPAPSVHRSGAVGGRSAAGLHFDRVLKTAAARTGFADTHVRGAVCLFHALTRESLDHRTSWPAPQLSSLAGGVPVEFSVSATWRAAPSVRYTAEIGDVQAVRDRRRASARAALGRAAALLGYGEAWERAARAVDVLMALPRSPSPLDRSCLWAGVDQLPGGPDGPDEVVTLLKAYALAPPPPHRDDALHDVLRACGVAVSAQTASVCGELQREGAWQEIGFALGPRGRFGCKVYFELPGWRRALASRVLDGAGFPPEVDALCPAIPNLLEESLAAHSRAGISLGLCPASGDIVGVTTTAAFIQGFLRPLVVAERVESWITTNGWNPAPHRTLFEALGKFADPADRANGPRHTILTRTLLRSGERRATVYIRPGTPATGLYQR